MKEEILYLENLVTNQTAGQNLEYVSLALNRGEILGITGSGDSGATALADVLLGRLNLSGGTLCLEGRNIVCDSPARAREYGIYGISYGSATISGMSVSENMNVLRPFRRQDYLIWNRRILEITQAVFQQYQIGGDPNGTAARLTAGQCMEVSICRALLCGAKVLVCQEVGEGFSEAELDEFERFLHQIRDEGMPVIMFNSDSGKVLRCADRVAVMRGGMICYESATATITPEEIYHRMHVPKIRPPSVRRDQASLHIAALREFSPLGYLGEPVALDLFTGAVQGIIYASSGGVDAFYGAFSGVCRTPGVVVENDKTVSFSVWRRRNAERICCLSNRFWENGLYENLTAGENILLPTLCRFRSQMGILNRRMLSLALREFCEAYEMDADCLTLYPRHLSSERRNQIVLLRVLFSVPRILVLDHPFYTIDEQIKGDLLHCIAYLKARGTSILCASNSASLLDTICDSVVDLFPASEREN